MSGPPITFPDDHDTPEPVPSSDKLEYGDIDDPGEREFFRRRIAAFLERILT